MVCELHLVTSTYCRALLVGSKFDQLEMPTPYGRTMETKARFCHDWHWGLALLQRKRSSVFCQSSPRWFSISPSFTEMD